MEQQKKNDSLVEHATAEQIKSDTQFPHDAMTEHWDIDFSNSKESYEGMELPVWILAGWAVFIIWAVIYLTAGIRTTF